MKNAYEWLPAPPGSIKYIHSILISTVISSDLPQTPKQPACIILQARSTDPYHYEQR